MTYLPRTDEALARQVLTGSVCAECCEPLAKSLGRPTLCTGCWNERRRVATEGFLKANRHDEQSVAAARAKHGKGL